MRVHDVRKILVAAAFGVMVTLAVAWGIAGFADLHTFRGQYQTPASSWRTPGYLADVLQPAKAGREMPGRVPGYRLAGVDFPVPTDSGLDAGWFTVWTSEFGWPFYAMRWDEMNFPPMHDDQAKERIASIQSAFDARAGWRRGLEVGTSPTNGPARRLPMSPIWGGLAANSAIVGLAAWLTMTMPGALRRAWRRSKGRCPKCGYDARGLPRCPECGEGAPSGGSWSRAGKA